MEDIAIVAYAADQKKHIGKYLSGAVQLKCWKCKHVYVYVLGSDPPMHTRLHGDPPSGEVISEFMFKRCPECDHTIAVFTKYSTTGVFASKLGAFFG